MVDSNNWGWCYVRHNNSFMMYYRGDYMCRRYNECGVCNDSFVVDRDNFCHVVYGYSLNLVMRESLLMYYSLVVDWGDHVVRVDHCMAGSSCGVVGGVIGGTGTAAVLDLVVSEGLVVTDQRMCVVETFVTSGLRIIVDGLGGAVVWLTVILRVCVMSCVRGWLVVMDLMSNSDVRRAESMSRVISVGDGLVLTLSLVLGHYWNVLWLDVNLMDHWRDRGEVLSLVRGYVVLISTIIAGVRRCCVVIVVAIEVDSSVSI